MLKIPSKLDNNTKKRTKINNTNSLSSFNTSIKSNVTNIISNNDITLLLEYNKKLQEYKKLSSNNLELLNINKIVKNSEEDLLLIIDYNLKYLTEWQIKNTQNKDFITAYNNLYKIYINKIQEQFQLDLPPIDSKSEKAFLKLNDIVKKQDNFSDGLWISSPVIRIILSWSIKWQWFLTKTKINELLEYHYWSEKKEIKKEKIDIINKIIFDFQKYCRIKKINKQSIIELSNFWTEMYSLLLNHNILKWFFNDNNINDLFQNLDISLKNLNFNNNKENSFKLVIWTNDNVYEKLIVPGKINNEYLMYRSKSEIYVMIYNILEELKLNDNNDLKEFRKLEVVHPSKNSVLNREKQQFHNNKYDTKLLNYLLQDKLDNFLSNFDKLEQQNQDILNELYLFFILIDDNILDYEQDIKINKNLIKITFYATTTEKRKLRKFYESIKDSYRDLIWYNLMFDFKTKK